MEKCAPTDDHVEGPFYRPGSPDATDIYPPDSNGSVLWFSGSVSDINCKPLISATIEVWQADEEGHYDNDDPNSPPTDFRCRGRMKTDTKGLFYFRTVLPSNYPVPQEAWVRVKHIHFKLYASGYQPLTTEIDLLPDDYVSSDQLYNPNLAVILQSSDALGDKVEYRAHFDFVLRPISVMGYSIAAKSRVNI